jgi:trehalose 6-phosphate synthase
VALSGVEQDRWIVVRLERQGGGRQRGGTPGEGELHQIRAGNVTLATVDLSREDFRPTTWATATACCGRYSTIGWIWPTSIRRHLNAYRRVNQLFARKLAPLLKPDDVIWIHDYHLIPLAAELRAIGCGQRIGFFLHIPLPPADPGHHSAARG